MLREETVFGPIRSRRLGTSLGINLMPEKGKICNFDCIYCECGWNRDGTDDRALPSRACVSSALEKRLAELASQGVSIDSITFSGDGESTLHPDFAAIIDDTVALRDKYFPEAMVSVLSNATRIHVDSVFGALRKVDKAILKIDAPTDALAARINNPAPGYSVRRVVEAMKRFGGDFTLQTMFLSGPGFDSSSPEVIEGWMDIVRELRPREIMVYSIDRPTPSAGLVKFSRERMASLVEPLVREGFNVRIY